MIFISAVPISFQINPWMEPMSIMNSERQLTALKVILICQSLKHWCRIAHIQLLREPRAVDSHDSAFLFAHNVVGITWKFEMFSSPRVPGTTAQWSWSHIKTWNVLKPKWAGSCSTESEWKLFSVERTAECPVSFRTCTAFLWGSR